MARPALEVADIFRDHGAAWRTANAGHVSLGQLKVMSAIERCRTAALGGHVAALRGLLAHDDRLQQLPQSALPEVPGRSGEGVAGRARGRAAAGRLLPRRVHAAGPDRRHRLPEQGGDLRPPVQGVGRDADHHRRRSEAPRRQDRHHLRAAHLGLGDDPPSARAHDRARRRAIALDGERWIACRPDFFLPVRVLSRLFRRLFLEKLAAAHAPASSRSSASTAQLADADAFAPILAPLARRRWVVYAKRPFAGPEGRARLSVALHPPRRDLQPPAGRGRRTASRSATRTIGSTAPTGSRP